MIGWVDLETTGLDHTVDGMLEIALVVTDDGLGEVATYEAVLAYNGPPLGSIPQVVVDMHTESGLFTATMSDEAKPLFQVEDEILDLLHGQFGGQQGEWPLGGSSVHFDRRFLMNYMPKLEQWFHYRCIDVSTVKELAARWAPRIWETRPQEEPKAHRAMADVRHSLKELNHYQENIFWTAAEHFSA